MQQNEQYSDEWWAARLGKASASRMGDIMAKGRGGAPSASRKNYMMTLLCERLTGQKEESFTSAAMQRGTDLEPLARGAYEVHTGLDVTEVGFVIHPTIELLGASPDGQIEPDGCLEIKNPNTAQHVAVLQSGGYDQKYHWQMMCQMACTGMDWCDFASFDDRMPEALQLHVCRVKRNDEDIARMESEVMIFLEELERLESAMILKMEREL